MRQETMQLRSRVGITGRVRRSLVGAAAVAALLPAAACSSTGDLLQVTDPDIINPSDLTTPEGAEALRVGALSRFIGATTGYNGGSNGETLFLYGGLLADEWQTGDSFTQRIEADQRSPVPDNSLVDLGYAYAQRARLSAEQALAALRAVSPNAPRSQLAELYFVQAYTENLLAETFCSGVPFSTVIAGKEQYGTPTTSTAAYERALAHADSGLALITGTTAGDVRVRSALQVTRGRILLNLNRPADAATAVAGVATTFAYQNQHSQTTRDNVVWSINNSVARYTVANAEGRNGLNFASAADPRLPVCAGGSTACRAAGITATKVFNSGSPTPYFAQLLWPSRESAMTVAGGVEARLIEAEAALKAGNATQSLAILNALRAGTTGLAPLTDAGTDAARQDQLFRERAFWLFGTGHRLGDLRRLVRQYGRTQDAVFPVGTFAEGGSYGTAVNFPIPQSELNNPQAQQGCLDRNA